MRSEEGLALPKVVILASDSLDLAGLPECLFGRAAVSESMSQGPKRGLLHD